MKRRLLLTANNWGLLVLMCLIILSSTTYAQQTGSVRGQIVDASNNEPLMLGNVYVKETSIGTVADEKGQYVIRNVPSGEQTIVISYIGYESIEIPVTVQPGEMVNLGVTKLGLADIMGQEVEITAQLQGQAAAINQQINSNNIVNVVSKERIQDIPDVNAAESISRLPGVTLSRSGGEGAQVSVRGVAPRFNTVTVNGQIIPSTGTNNRSVNMSMISAEMLDGIELFKALTPDMEANSIGGSINLVTRTADSSWNGWVQIEGGYNDLIEDFGQYRGVFTASNRFFDNKVGIVVGGNYQDADRSTDFFNGDYELTGNGGYRGNNAEFNNRLETRKRYGFNITTDYQFRKGELVFDYFFTETTRDVITRSLRARPTVSQITYGFGRFENFLSLNSYNLRGEFEIFDYFDLNFSVGRSKTTNDTPTSYGTGADQQSGFTEEADEAEPLDMFLFARPNLDETFGGDGLGWSFDIVNDINYNAQIDLKAPFALNNAVSGYFKFGGKVRHRERDRGGRTFNVFDSRGYFNAFIDNFPQFTRNGEFFQLSNFIDQSYTGYDSPFADHNDIPFVFDPDIVEERYNVLSNIDSLWVRNFNAEFDRYDAIERITAGYVMSVVNVGKKLTFIPGVRFENTYNKYTGVSGRARNNDIRFDLRDSTASNSVGLFFPMFHVKYNILDQLSIRLAATRTLSRPDFLNLAPFTREIYSNQNRVTFGSLDLDIPTSWNYDAFLTYFSKIGLFSIGAFYKDISDIDIRVSFIDWSGTEDTNPYRGWIVTSPINSRQATTIYGAEVDIQTNFRYLPKPFDGLVLTANFSLMESETFYPFFFTDFPPPDFLPATVDSFRVNSTQGQADYIANVTLGYEKRGFNARVSMNLQGAKLQSSGASPFQDEFEDEYLRWDATISQKFGDHWQLIANLININSAVERNYIFNPNQPSQISHYGWQGVLALRYRL